VKLNRNLELPKCVKFVLQDSVLDAFHLHVVVNFVAN